MKIAICCCYKWPGGTEAGLSPEVRPAGWGLGLDSRRSSGVRTVWGAELWVPGAQSLGVAPGPPFPHLEGRTVRSGPSPLQTFSSSMHLPALITLLSATVKF